MSEACGIVGDMASVSVHESGGLSCLLCGHGGTMFLSAARGK